MASCSGGKHVLLTGPPGIGKTTLVRSVCQRLQKDDGGISLRRPLVLGGFYTEELRHGRNRIGFDVVTLNNERSPLARLNNGGSHGVPVVGRYFVDVPSFEEAVLPLFKSKVDVMIIDEIGKMELYSRSFTQAVKNVFDQSVVVLATVPASKGRSLQLVEDIKKRPDCLLYEVTKENRDSLCEAIVKHIKQKSQK